MEYITNSAEETQKIAKEILLKVSQKKIKNAAVLALTGDLGAGKTTFVQGLARELKISEPILSPTFVILKHFNIQAFKMYNNLYHVDCYRIEKSEELKELGFKEILEQPESLAVIEWAEKIKEILPKDAIWLEFEHRGEDKRRIKIYDL